MKTTTTLFAAVVLGAGLLSATGVNAALISVLGGQAVNDTDLNITWLADANLAASNTFGVAGIDPAGRMNWDTAQSWIAAMNTAIYLGYSDWRLPTTVQPDASCDIQEVGASLGVNCTGSEMGHLFYTELGGTAGNSILSSSDPDLALFQNLQSFVYWSGTEDALAPGSAWAFGTRDGSQNPGSKSGDLFALAVRPGQVATAAVPVPVPEPATLVLLGMGLAGLGWARRSALR